MQSCLILSKDKLIKAELDDVKFGALLPLVVLETDDFEAEYRDYILDVLESNEQTLNNIFRGWRAIAYFCMDKGWIEPRTIHVKEIEPTIREVYTDSEIQKLLEKPNPEKFPRLSKLGNHKLFSCNGQSDFFCCEFESRRFGF